EAAARGNRLPVGVLTRLVWAESRFHPRAVSPAGAQGVAQFMPQTAGERGLTDPFDPEQAIPAAARLLVDLDPQFGNIGLAAATPGPARGAEWLGRTGPLPRETRRYVIAVTGRTAEDWAMTGRASVDIGDDGAEPSCLAVTAALSAGEGSAGVPVAPWGVQLAG